MKMNNFAKLKKELKNAEKIVLLPHINMDGDSVGSAFSFASCLREMGKTVCVALGEEPPKYLSFLCDEYEIMPEDDFDLAIAVDCGDEERMADRAHIFENAKKNACIDHHISNIGFAGINVIEPDVSSTSEIMYRLINELTGNITKRQADQLYSGMITDTGGFKYSNTTPESLEYCADLMRKGADAANISINIYETQSVAKIKLMNRALKSIELHAEGRISSIVITNKDFEETKGTIADCEGFSGIARGIEGVEAAISITQTDKVKVSLRSKSIIDVSKVAGFFGGGGHIRASGFSLSADTNIEELKKEIVEKLVQALKEAEK
ncbi:MAG: bifunctional oligoribonuclease/PAP phosphatase NrnA [Bacillota bacterium]|nr:bifunctional oligoribonuclease/PAP phosphatase NrnA [Bacillota bacterium]